MSEHRRRYRLGFGVAVEFVFRAGECQKDDLSTTALVCEWDPAMPRFRPGNAKNKFLRRYNAARDDFLQDVAQLLGGSILNIDLDERGRPGEMTVFRPGGAVMSPDTITFALPADGRTTLAKIIRVEADRIVGKEKSPNVKTFSYIEAPVHDLGSLYLAVKRAAHQGAIAIRAKPKKSIGNRRMHLRNDGIEPNLDVAPRRWVGFDWDDLPLDMQPCPNPRWFWHPDPLLEPWLGARIALRRLPPAFREVSCFWQVSAGAGFNKGFRLRTWHWLNHPVIGAELKVWLQPAIERGLVDPVTLVEVQPHYLGVRVIGGADPCPRRFGFLRLARQEVQVPDIHGIKRRQEEMERAKRPPEQRQAPRDPEQVHAYAQSRIDECLAAIKSAAARHTTYKEQAARARAIALKYGLDWQPIRQDLIAAYESALTPAEAKERRSFSTEGVLDWLEARSAA